MKHMSGWLALGAVLIGGCAGRPEFHSAGPEWIDNKTGNLIALKVKAGECQERQDVLVENPWAALIVWNDGSRFFCLYDNQNRSYVATDSWAEFLAVVGSMAEGAQLQNFHKCSAPWDYLMPEAERDQLAKVMNSRGQSWRQFKGDELDTLMVCIHGGGVEFPPR